MLLLGAQLVTLVLVAALVVTHFELWAGPGDERAHFANVEAMAHGHLLREDRDVVSPAVEAITDGFYPLPSPIAAARNGLRGRAYEAFQPPLYYAVAAPVYILAGPDTLDQARALRWLDLGLLLAAVAACVVLARQICGGAWPLGLALALCALLRPGAVVRAITVSNATLELPLVLWTIASLWWAASTRRLGPLLLAAALVGLDLLTKETLLYLLVPLVLVAVRGARGRADSRSRRDRAHQRGRAAAELAVVLAIPALLLAPWIASNLDRYGTPTADLLARRVQREAINPAGRHYGLADIPSGEARLLGGLLPEEWQSQSSGGLLALTVGLDIVVVGGAAAELIGPWRRGERAREIAVVGLPVLVAAALLAWATVADDFSVFQARYLYALWPVLALVAARCWSRVGGRWPTLGLAGGLSAGLLAAWAVLADRLLL